MKKPEKEICEQLAKRVTYDAETGVITWLPKDGDLRETRRWNTRFAGKEAGNLGNTGYRTVQLKFNGICYFVMSHRLVYFICTGALPKHGIDHINHQKTDNRITNLRDVPQAENNKNSARRANNTSGVCGVIWHKPNKKWLAKSSHLGKRQHIGMFDTLADAEAAVLEYRRTHGYLETHGL